MEDIYGQKVLISAMNDPEEGVRMHATRLPGKHTNTEVTTILIEALDELLTEEESNYIERVWAKLDRQTTWGITWLEVIKQIVKV